MRTFLFFILVLLSLSLVSGIVTKDDFCLRLNVSSFDDCDTYWSLLNKNNTINTTVVVNQTFNYTVYQTINQTINLTINQTIQNFSLLNYSYIVDVVDSRIKDFNPLTFDQQLALRKLEFDQELALKQSEKEEKEPECDVSCQLDKDFKAKLEAKALKEKYCTLSPELDGCQEKKVEVVNMSSQDDKFLQLFSRIDSLSSQVNQPKPKEDYTLYLVLGGLLCIGGYLYYKNGQDKVVRKLNDSYRPPVSLEQDPKSFFVQPLKESKPEISRQEVKSNF